MLEHEDEVLYALAHELGKLVLFLKEDSICMLGALEKLAGIEETIVREQAVKSLCVLFAHSSQDSLTHKALPVVYNLAVSDSFSSRISACGLCVAAYSFAEDQKETLRQTFTNLCQDDISLVRRAAARVLGKFALVIEKSNLVEHVVGNFNKLYQDDQDQVKVLCLDSLVEIAKVLDKEESKRHIFPVFISLSEEKNWRIKYHFAEKLPEIAKVLGTEALETNLIVNLAQLLKDTEEEVKSAGLFALEELLPMIPQDKLHGVIFPPISVLACDTSAKPSVRKNACRTLSKLSKFVPTEFCLSQVLPIIIERLTQENNTEIKQEVIEGLCEMSSILGSDLLSGSLIEALDLLSKDCPNWRLRESSFKAFVVLGKKLGIDEFISHLQSLFFRFLSDKVSTIRETGVQNCKEFFECFGMHWAETHLLPKLQETFHSQELSYSHRITVLKVLECIPLNEVSLVVFEEASKDSVPNVRLAFCQVYEKLKHKSDKLDQLISTLTEDSDKDVKYFAKRALNSKKCH